MTYIRQSLICALGSLARFWSRVYGFLIEQNEQAVAQWAASLEYRRRYTNPDDAKRYRRNR